MEIKAFDKDFTTTKKLCCRTPLVEQLFAEPLLVEYLSIATSIKLKII